MAGEKHCKDCGPDSKRPASRPGPRCETHWRAEVKRRKQQAHGRHVTVTYGISETEYQAIYKAQGGKCFICQRATGATKNLAVDHDHRTGEVRGLLCGPCNKYIGQLRDDIQALARAIMYLQNPPARKVLKQ